MIAKKSLLLLFSTFAVAGTLTLEEAIEKTFKTDPTIQIASLRYDGALQEGKIANAGRYPSIHLNGAYYPTKTYVMPTNGTFSTKQNEGIHADVSGVYSLWDGGRIHQTITAAQRAQDGAKSTQKMTQNERIEEVLVRFYAVAFSKAVIQSAESSVAFYDELYTQALNMRKNGLKTEADELRFNASRMEARDRLEWAKNEYDKASMALGVLVGSSEPVDVETSQLQERAQRIQIHPMNIESLRQALKTDNSQLKALQANVNRAKAINEASEAQRYGEITLVASAAYDDSLSAYDSYHAGIVGSVPLYDGGKLTAQSQKSRIEHTIALQELQSAERALWQELYGAYRDMLRADETIKVKHEVFEATQKALVFLKERYKQGLSSYVDVLEAQKTLDEAQTAIAEGEYQKIRSFARVEKLLDKGCDHYGCQY